MRYIDADALKKDIHEQVVEYIADALDEYIDAQPTADVKPVVRGEWIEVAVTDGYDIEGVKTWVSVMQCSQCGFIVNAVEGHMAQYNFCPNCGAYMRGERDD